MSVLVTGAKGYLGAELTRRLVSYDQDVVCLDIKTSPGRLADVANQVTFLGGGLGDAETLRKKMREYDVTHVAHMVYVSGEGGLEFLHQEIATMVGGTVDVLEASRRAGVRRVFFPSSTHYYGPQWAHGDVWLNEQASSLTGTVYGVSKKLNETIARRYAAESVVQVVTFRLPAIYGPGAKVGARGVNIAAVAAANGISAVLPYPEDQQVCVSHVADVADCIARALLGESPRYLVYNIGGHVTTYGEIAEIVRRIVPGAEITFTSGSRSDLPYLIDQSLAVEDLGLVDRSLEDGLREIIHAEIASGDRRVES